MRNRVRSPLNLLVISTWLIFQTACGASSVAPSPKPAGGGDGGGGGQGGQAPVQTSVVTYHNDLQRTGANVTEVKLTPNNVNSTTFGKKLALPVDGQIYAQPLYVPALTINGKKYDVVFVATENNSVYAFDSNAGGPPLWQASLGTPVPKSDAEGITPMIGITSTPVIDQQSQTMFVVAYTSGGGFYLHALDITTGKDRVPAVQIKASVAGTGTDSVNGTISLSKACYQRSGLVLANGNVYVAFAHCNHGWIVAYSENPLQQVGIFNTTPNGRGGTIWMGGGAGAVDSAGNVFYLTSTDAGCYDPGYNDSVLRTSPTLSVVDYFTPSNNQYLMDNDLDLGSGGAVIMPDNGSAHPHEIIGGGKEGRLWVLDRDNLGKQNSPDADVQMVSVATSAGDNLYSTPAFWNGRIYVHSNANVIEAFDWQNGLLSNAPTMKGSYMVKAHGATVSISANGAAAGIAWEIDNTAYPNGPAILRAYDATNLSNELYDSAQAAGGRDTAGQACKFTVPTIADGKVFVGTGNELDVYGLLNQP
jgi:hypothetical protein